MIVVDTKHLFDYFIINEKPRNALGMKARRWKVCKILIRRRMLNSLQIVDILDIGVCVIMKNNNDIMIMIYSFYDWMMSLYLSLISTFVMVTMTFQIAHNWEIECNTGNRIWSLKKGNIKNDLFELANVLHLNVRCEIVYTHNCMIFKDFELLNINWFPRIYTYYWNAY